MAFGIIRVRNVHMNEVRLTEIHNDRQFSENGLKRPEHIKPFDWEQGTTHDYWKCDTEHKGGGLNTEELINKRFEETGIKPRKNAVVALEYVLTMSPEAMIKINESYQMDTMLSYLTQFIEGKHGAKNIISISKHYDESNPHVHVLAVPIEEKKVKWKNRNGEGIKIENRLCARDYTGDKDKLRELQTNYFKYLTEDFPINLKKDFNIELKRGVDARDKRARGEFYSKMTNHVLGEVRKELAELRENHQNMSKQDYQKKEDDLKLKITSISDGIEKKRSKDGEIYNQNEKWSKNTSKINLDKTPWPQKDKDQDKSQGL